MFFKKTTWNVVLCIRFSSDEPDFALPEKKPNPTSSSRDRRASDWLGLRSDDDFLAAGAANTKSPSETPLLERRPSPADTVITSAEATEPSVMTNEVINKTNKESSKSNFKEEAKDDWLSGALRRKAPSESPFSERRPPSTVSHAGSAPVTENGSGQTDDARTETSKNQHKGEEDDWLAAVLRRKTRVKAEDTGLRQEVDLELTVG